MAINRWVALALSAPVLVTSCSASDDDDSGPLITSDAYYETMQLGEFATFTEQQLDDIGSSLCSDMQNLEDDGQRRGIVLVLREQTSDELEAFAAALAITARHCPDYFHLWDDEVEDMMGGELPWERR